MPRLFLLDGFSKVAQLGQHFMHTESWKYKVAGSENHRLRGCGLLPALQGYPGSWTPQQRIPVHHFCHPGNWPRTGGSNIGRARPCWRHLKDPCLQTPSEGPWFRPGSTLSRLTHQWAPVPPWLHPLLGHSPMGPSSALAPPSPGSLTNGKAGRPRCLCCDV